MTSNLDTRKKNTISLACCIQEAWYHFWSCSLHQWINLFHWSRKYLTGSSLSNEVHWSEWCQSKPWITASAVNNLSWIKIESCRCYGLTINISQQPSMIWDHQTRCNTSPLVTFRLHGEREDGVNHSMVHFHSDISLSQIMYTYNGNHISS